MLVTILAIIFKLYNYALIIRCVLSFFPEGTNVMNNPFSEFIYKITDPLMRPFQKIIPPLPVGGAYIDFSPIIVFIVYDVAVGLILNLLSAGLPF